jgi:hypothetical protein
MEALEVGTPTATHIVPFQETPYPYVVKIVAPIPVHKIPLYE